MILIIVLMNLWYCYRFPRVPAGVLCTGRTFRFPQCPQELPSPYNRMAAIIKSTAGFAAWPSYDRPAALPIQPSGTGRFFEELYG